MKQKLNDLQARKKHLENILSDARGELVGISEEIRDIAPKVAAQIALQRWKDAAPDREALRSTVEWQEWRKKFLHDEKIRKQRIV